MSAQKVSAARRAKALAELAGGAAIADVAKRYGVTTTGVRYWQQVGVKPSKTAAPANPHAVRDAIVFLRKAKGEMLAGLRNGTITDLDGAHLLSLLALQSLQQPR